MANGQIASIFILPLLSYSLDLEMDAFIHDSSFSFNEGKRILEAES
jgi:hypothetical protein